ncbi:MAG TPA: hypothetical protein DC042_13455 [Bacteroidales bacterium]|nr:hypothetical protein [Bacteroidales bacterium]
MFGNFVQFLYISLGSLAELETQLIICERLEFCGEDLSHHYDDCDRIRRMLQSLIRYIKQ